LYLIDAFKVLCCMLYWFSCVTTEGFMKDCKKYPNLAEKFLLKSLCAFYSYINSVLEMYNDNRNNSELYCSGVYVQDYVWNLFGVAMIAPPKFVTPAVTQHLPWYHLNFLALQFLFKQAIYPRLCSLCFHSNTRCNPKVLRQLL
jgi:hypothetical protein